ncbi:hypothetical protein ACIGNX_00845 [Actinosynnema sp. NPDC053489]|uniref:hypothetical protein n=1 Tax=Actinosynnema sp. NPDC053489 TaxID=3363916 RepID=UPI0037C8832E
MVEVRLSLRAGGVVFRGAVIALACLLLGTGCAGRGASRAAFDLLTRTGTYDRVNGVLASAEHRLVGACMAALGLTYRTDPAAAQGSGAVTAADRRQTGYGLHARYAGSPASVPANDEYVRSLSTSEQAKYRRALEGGDEQRRAIRLGNGATVSFPGAGCLAQAHRELYGDVVEWARITYVPQALHASMAKRVQGEPGYRTAVGAWSACMGGRGLPAATPESAQARLQALYEERGPSEELQAREVSVAVADWECAERVRLPEVVLDAKRRLFSALPEEDREDLVRLADAWTAAAARSGAH